jgi:hypothetical protein
MGKGLESRFRIQGDGNSGSEFRAQGLGFGV